MGEPSDGTNFGGNEILNHSLGFAGEKMKGGRVNCSFVRPQMASGKWQMANGKLQMTGRLN